jgi:trans-2-enoyl-CoA reductase
MRDVQKKVASVVGATTETLPDIDLAGYKQDFLNLFGRLIKVDYNADVNEQVAISSM